MFFFILDNTYAALGHSNIMAFQKETTRLENLESPNQTTQRLVLKQSNRITIFCWSYQS